MVVLSYVQEAASSGPVRLRLPSYAILCHLMLSHPSIARGKPFNDELAGCNATQRNAIAQSPGADGEWSNTSNGHPSVFEKPTHGARPSGPYSVTMPSQSCQLSPGPSRPVIYRAMINLGPSTADLLPPFSVLVH